MSQWHCCRTCLAVTSLNPIFSTTNNNEYSIALSTAVGVKIQIDDELPQVMCSKCLEMVTEIMAFQKKAIHSQKVLSEQVQSKQKYLNITVKIENDNDLNVDKKNYEDYDFLENDDNHSEPNDYVTTDCTSTEKLEKEKFVMFESTVEEILKKRLKFDFENLKPSCIVKSKRKDTAKGENYVNKDILNSEIKQDESLSNDLSETVKENRNNDPPSKPYECEYCHKQLKSKFSYVSHLKIHTAMKKICEHCGKQFLDRRRLLMHCKAKHGYQKTDKCSYCNWAGTSAEAVKIHERLHTGEKPYVCEICSASFHRQSSYLQHRPIHLPEKTVQCDQCPALFKSVTLMRIHKTRHKPREYKHKCLVCFSFFSKRWHCLRHLQRIHSIGQALDTHIARVRLTDIEK